ncbi:hypothetical protein AAG570_014065 [Ranatra chinensis]|uniref:Eukaryotic translation initiation factor 3 subunit C N-terminal domain-containing protein n=1 Tax=Ranatra chinensis TaxID=642074 RepID=A0ABD0XS28_9HEMI
MSSMLNSFEDLMRAYQKAIPVIAKEENGVVPRFYLRCLVELDDFINEVWEDREGRKNMSKNNSKSLASLRQKLRKYNKEFEEDISKFRENPDQADEDEEQPKEVDDDSDGDTPGPAAFKKGGSEASGAKMDFHKGPPIDDDEGSDGSINWGSDSDTTTESSEDESQSVAIRERFLKKTTDKDEEEKKERKKERKEKEKRKHKEGEDDGEEGWEVVRGGVAIPTEKPKMFAKDAEIDLNLVLKKLGEIVAARGKKRTDRREQIELLHELQAVADAHHLGPAIAIKIKLAIISSIFDYNPKVSDAMKPEYWAKLLERISEALDMLLVTPDIIIGENISEENECYDKQPYRIRGCILTIVERLDEEFIKLLKECDPHSNEYVQRLTDEKRVTSIIDKVQLFLEKQSVNSELCRIYMRKIEHLYYKFDPNVLKQKKVS